MLIHDIDFNHDGIMFVFFNQLAAFLYKVRWGFYLALYYESTQFPY